MGMQGGRTEYPESGEVRPAADRGKLFFRDARGDRRSSRETVELKPGVRSMLAKLQAEGAMCICSNTWAEQCRTVLTRLGIAQYFSFIVEAQGVLHKAARSVLECMSRLGGADPAACAVCEDAVYAAATAHKAGYYVIGITGRTSCRRRAGDAPHLQPVRAGGMRWTGHVCDCSQEEYDIINRTAPREVSLICENTLCDFQYKGIISVKRRPSVMNNPLVSIIVPVYNVQNSVARCLESICAQTWKDIEVILVNDGSRDESFSICEQFREKDPPIVLVDKSNSGVSETRNCGMSLAGGQVCAVCGQ